MLSLVLAVVLVVGLLFPVVVINGDDVEFPADFEGGRYTSKIEPAESYEYGVGFAIDYLTYGGYIAYVLDVQLIDSEIAECRANMLLYPSDA